MSMTLTGTGGLFTRLGRIFFAIESANLYVGNTDISAGGLKTVGISTTDVLAQFLSTLQSVPDGITSVSDGTRFTLAQWKSYLRSLAEKTVVEMAHADVTLVSKDIETALQELIVQMAGAGTIYNADNDVDAPTVSATVAALASNTGTASVAASVVRPDGRSNELVFPENLEIVCASGEGQGATARSETCSLRGERSASDSLSYDWPGGSGTSSTLAAIDSSLDGSGNMLYNSDFESFTTTNQPDYWGTPLVGTGGTDIFEEGTVVLRTGKALKLTGTGGGPLSSIAQSFAQASVAVGTSGNPSTLKPTTVYAVNFWARKSAGVAAGVIQCRLLDSSNVQTTDDAGTNNSFTVAHGALSSSVWTAVQGFFRTGKTVTPTTAYKLNVRLSTALTNGESFYIDDLAMVEATLAYTGGPFVAIFAGATNLIANDKFTVAIANNRAGSFQEWFDRCFNMKSLALQLPSDTGGAETIVDSLIS